jgi:hypothetical protein
LKGVAAADMLSGVDGAAIAYVKEDSGSSYTENNSLHFLFYVGYIIVV